MPRAIPPFAKTLALFFVQGLILWALSFYQDDDYLSLMWLSAVGTLAAWWAIWLALHPQHTWQPWLESLALAGAVYWLPIFCDEPLRDWLRSEERNRMFAPAAIAYLTVAIAAATAFPMALLLCGVRWMTGWRLQASTTTRQVGLRGMFLVMLCAALHLLAFKPLLEPLFSLTSRPGWGEIYFWSIALLFMSWTASIVLGIAMLVLGRRMPIRSVLVIAIGTAGLAATIIIRRSDLETSLQWVRWMLAAIYMTAFINALALRAIGYRLGRLPRQTTESAHDEAVVNE
jgi:hypothetical protein